MRRKCNSAGQGGETKVTRHNTQRGAGGLIRRVLGCCCGGWENGGRGWRVVKICLGGEKKKNGVNDWKERCRVGVGVKTKIHREGTPHE